MRTIVEPQKQISVVEEVDVIVADGASSRRSLGSNGGIGAVLTFCSWAVTIFWRCNATAPLIASLP